MTGSSFADAVAFEDLGGDRFRSADERGIPFFLGGKEVGIATHAAASTVPKDQRLLSVGTYFIGRRDPQAPLFFDVRRVRDGRSFTTREIDAVGPDGSVWFRSVATFHVAEDGADQQVAQRTGAKPDELSEPEVGKQIGPDLLRHAIAFPWDADFEVRADPSVDDTTYRVWFRSRVPMGDDQAVQDAAVVYASDLRGGSPGLLVTGWPEVRMMATSLDHTVWLHRPFRADEWFLVEAHAESTSGARSLVHGTFHDAAGTRVASWAQTVLVRPMPAA